MQLGVEPISARRLTYCGHNELSAYTTRYARNMSVFQPHCGTAFYAFPPVDDAYIFFSDFFHFGFVGCVVGIVANAWLELLEQKRNDGKLRILR